MMKLLGKDEVASVNGGQCESEYYYYVQLWNAFQNMNPSDPGYYEMGNAVQAADAAYQYCMANSCNLIYVEGYGYVCS